MVICVTEATPEEVIKVAAKLCGKETEVIVLHVVRILTELQKKDAEEKFAWVLSLLEKEGIKARLELVESADAKSAIVSFVKNVSADIVVTGTIQKKGILGVISESISDYLIKHIPCTLILVKRAD
ncbi:MAG: universal stress protein [Candidatus Hadarchaeales archaeon]